MPKFIKLLITSSIFTILCIPALSFAETIVNDQEETDTSSCVEIENVFSTLTKKTDAIKTDIITLQKFLKEHTDQKGVPYLATNVSTSGNFGPLTIAALKAFQKEKYEVSSYDEIDDSIVASVVTRKSLAGRSFAITPPTYYGKSKYGKVDNNTRAKIAYVSCNEENVTGAIVQNKETNTANVAIADSATPAKGYSLKDLTGYDDVTIGSRDCNNDSSISEENWAEYKNSSQVLIRKIYPGTGISLPFAPNSGSHPNGFIPMDVGIGSGKKYVISLCPKDINKPFLGQESCKDLNKVRFTGNDPSIYYKGALTEEEKKQTCWLDKNYGYNLIIKADKNLSSSWTELQLQVGSFRNVTTANQTNGSSNNAVTNNNTSNNTSASQNVTTSEETFSPELVITDGILQGRYATKAQFVQKVKDVKYVIESCLIINGIYTLLGSGPCVSWSTTVTHTSRQSAVPVKEVSNNNQQSSFDISSVSCVGDWKVRGDFKCVSGKQYHVVNFCAPNGYTKTSEGYEKEIGENCKGNSVNLGNNVYYSLDDQMCTGIGPNDPTLSKEHWKNRITLRDCKNLINKGGSGVSLDAYNKITGCTVNVQELVSMLMLGDGSGISYEGGQGGTAKTQCARYVRDSAAQHGAACQQEGYPPVGKGELICKNGIYLYNCSTWMTWVAPKPVLQDRCSIENTSAVAKYKASSQMSATVSPSTDVILSNNKITNITVSNAESGKIDVCNTANETGAGCEENSQSWINGFTGNSIGNSGWTFVGNTLIGRLASEPWMKSVKTLKTYYRLSSDHKNITSTTLHFK